MSRNLRMAVGAAGLIAALGLGAGADRSYAQGYVPSPGGGYYYDNSASRGYTYPSYAYNYWAQGRSTLPSGYYAYPAGGAYYYQYYTPPAANAQPYRPSAGNAAPAYTAPAYTADPTSSRVAELEARVRQLEATVNRPAAAVQTSVPGTGNRNPNWSFDYNLWMAHNL